MNVIIIIMTVLVLIVGIVYWLGKRANRADWGHAGLNVLDGWVRIFCRYYHRQHAVDIPLPETGGVLLVANHLSGLDPLLLIAATQRPLRFIMAEEEYERWWLRWLFRAVGCIPVDRTGHPGPAIRRALHFLRAGEAVALFPFGQIHLDNDAPVAIKRGVVLLAEHTLAPIYPVRVEGIKGIGKSVMALLPRSRAMVVSFSPLHSADYSPEACLEKLAALLG